MAEFNIRTDSVDVEQIMRQIRARIKEKRGVDYTEQQIQELANVKLERFLDPKGVRSDLVEQFKAVQASTAADFCRDMYARMGLLDGIRLERSSDPKFRQRAVAIDDYFVDVTWEGETVRARHREGKLLLHKGADRYIELPPQNFGAAQISPTRDTRLPWMQSVIRCTHYVAGAGERQYLNEADAPGVIFVQREEISDSNHAYTGER